MSVNVLFSLPQAERVSISPTNENRCCDRKARQLQEVMDRRSRYLGSGIGGRCEMEIKTKPSPALSPAAGFEHAPRKMGGSKREKKYPSESSPQSRS
ncbi:hypothetical protein NPIL_267461 [Nephila pilipes]|uniref:Uncharacterized protein n=1 Tax=Nephila pilipes TaxID=299642 RepID=A0A8X6T081_NEPPI|nr:hypothetical protein NPIL_267461 [Nephila pilipes]